MRTRIISAAVGLVVLGIAVAAYDTAVLTGFVVLLSLIAAYEMLHACGCLLALDFSVLTFIVVSSIICLPKNFLLPEMLTLYAVLMLTLWLRWHGKYTAQQLGFAGGISVLIAMSFRCVLLMRRDFGHEIGLYALFVALVAAWMSDTGAYLAGRRFGKTKLCPHISPHKTVEGAIGGVMSAIIGQAMLAILFERIYSLQIRVGLLCLLSPILTLLGIVGDLSASVIKRDTGIKDYGNIMPGHGGVLDRFDSVLPLLPTVYLLFSNFVFAK